MQCVLVGKLKLTGVTAGDKARVLQSKPWGGCWWTRGIGVEDNTKSLSYPNEEMTINKDRLWVFMFFLGGHYKAVGLEGDDVVQCNFPGRTINSSSEDCAKEQSATKQVRDAHVSGT